MITPERLAELRRRVEVEQEDLNHGILHEMFNELDRLTAENARLSKVVDQAIDIIETHYDEHIGVDATNASIVWGIEWEDGAECVWTDEEKRELAAELEARKR